MCQRGDSTFAEQLCTDSCTSEDITVLPPREIKCDTLDYLSEVLHVCRLNADIDERIEYKLKKLGQRNMQALECTVLSQMRLDKYDADFITCRAI